MLAEERRMQLAEWSRIEGRIDAISAAKRLDVAVETVRRDLEVLQRRGVLRRVHGGAIATDRIQKEFDFTERKQTNPSSKREIAKVAARFIPERGCIFVDGGSTTEYLAEALENKPELLVVTASLTLAAQIARTGTPVSMLGGRVRGTSLSAVGQTAAKELTNYHAQVAFLGANGVSLEAGFTTADQDEALVKRLMIANSTEKILLADNSKFGAAYPAVFAKFNEIDRIITDINAPQE
ncbi:MAG: DeoR/GlpR transcriptional regulator, partial [Microbacteriaceae bacterium]|nr:DeoR/GlpR transcriptional regulator [Microbacteriaceae bacterium]